MANLAIEQSKHLHALRRLTNEKRRIRYRKWWNGLTEERRQAIKIRNQETARLRINKAEPKEVQTVEQKEQAALDFFLLDRKRRLMYLAHYRAKKFGVPFSLTLKDFHIPSECPIFKIPLKHNIGLPGPDSPALDRIIPSLGYVPGNVVVISRRANELKSNATIEELVKIATFYQKLTEAPIGENNAPSVV